jgi:sterol desaturase/sphingolipid hydroxylase (fatty acid hydroxylase superfamily)
MPPAPFLASSLASATWPLGAVAALSIHAASADKPGKQEEATPPPAPFASLSEHISMQIACIPRLLLVAAMYAYGYGDWRSYARTLSPAWVLPLVARDVALCLFVGCLDCFLLLSDASPFKASMHARKFNPAYPSLLQRSGTSSLVREALWCCSTAALAGLLEAGVLHAYATGRAEVVAAPAADAWWAHPRTIFFMVTWFYSQNVQFYAMHRAMHAWGTTTIPDVGAWLYKHVHSLHHQSKNPTAFSGISMHPFEAALYLSYALLPVLFGAHFVAFLYIKTNLIAAAMLCVWH